MTIRSGENNADVVIVGGGIVGLATALALLKHSQTLKVVVLEKESSVAKHQTGHNSGVIHSGLYYKPGSLKARNCLDGYTKLLQFCRENKIAHEVCGKIVVATSQSELGQLEMLYERGIANGLVGVRKLNQNEIQEIEPHCRGVAGLFVPQTGIVDYVEMANRMSQLVLSLGGEVRTGEEVVGIVEHPKDVVV